MAQHPGAPRAAVVLTYATLLSVCTPARGVTPQRVRNNGGDEPRQAKNMNGPPS